MTHAKADAYVPRFSAPVELSVVHKVNELISMSKSWLARNMSITSVSESLDKVASELDLNGRMRT
jgi:hypothetical protein